MPLPTDALASEVLRARTTPGAKLVLLHLLRSADAEGAVEVHVPAVADATCMTSRGVYKALEFLERDGLAVDLTVGKPRASKRRWQINLAALGGHGGGDR